ncbi:MAG TPA: GGDEF and EAL domain-containing protein [Kineosporiaceae bacterium]|nr:GGDEF and EAL domain-containing protein [Kineosporiaceae bacterium]
MREVDTSRDTPAQGQFLAAVSQARERIRLAAEQPERLVGELAAAVASLVEAPVTVALADGPHLVRRYVTAGAPLPVGTLVDLDATVCGEAVATLRAVRVDDLTDLPPGDPDAARVAARAGACCPGGRALLSVPLVDGTDVVGVVAVTSPAPHWFDRMTEHAVTLVAQAAAPHLAGYPRHPFGAGPAYDRVDVPSGPGTPAGGVFRVGAAAGPPRLERHPGGMPAPPGARRGPAVQTPGAAFPARAVPAAPAASGFAPPRAPLDPPGDDPVLRAGLTALAGASQVPGLGVWQWRPGAPELSWSRELYRVLGYDPATFRPTPRACCALVHPDDLPAARALQDVLSRAVDQHVESGAVETFRVYGADGAVRHLQVWATSTVDGGDVVVHGAVVDVTAPARDRMLLERLSTTDAVTGLGNRIAFERRMHELVASGAEVSLLLLDLDRFKLVNDSLGHQVGDRLLVEVARRVTEVVPAGSITARMGGDEFVVVPPAGTEWLAVRRLAQALVDTLRTPYVLPDSGEILVCPASLGVTSTAGRSVGTNELFSEADLALYRAKDSGRDRYVVYDDALRARARARHNAELLLRSALEEDRLKLQYQPIVDFETGRIVGAEALVRVLDPAGERLLPPDVFIEVAEDTGLVVELDVWVIDAALAQMSRWLRAVPGGAGVPWVAVNVSARSMEHPRVVRRLLDGMQRGGIGPELLKVELTEHSFLGTLPGGESTLRQLLASGVPVGIDDFGTGYSAMAYLNRFDLDFMKIDRSFVAQVGQEERADAVVTAIVDLAHAHGMFVTAEGVETQRQARRLREIGCDFAQGYHFGRPADAARLLRA